VAALTGFGPQDVRSWRRAACLSFAAVSLPFQVTPLLVAAARKAAERRIVRDVTRLRDCVASARKAPCLRDCVASARQAPCLRDSVASARQAEPGAPIPDSEFRVPDPGSRPAGSELPAGAPS
jgi:hypothetical protein